MPKRRVATAGEFKPKRSRYMRDVDAQDTLITVVIMWTIAIVGLSMLALELTGAADVIRSYII